MEGWEVWVGKAVDCDSRIFILSEGKLSKNQAYQ